MVSKGKNDLRSLFLRLASIIFLFLIFINLTSNNSDWWFPLLTLFIIAGLSALIGFWFFSHFIPLPASYPIKKIFSLILRTLRKNKIPTLQVQDSNLATWKIGEKYSEIINPDRHFLIIKKNDGFIQIVRQQYFELQTHDKLLGILGTGRIIRSITINVIYPLPNTPGIINKLDNFNPENPSELSERTEFDRILCSMDILLTFQLVSILFQQGSTSLSIPSSQDEPFITERIITDQIRIILENIWRDILINQNLFNGKNISLLEENLDLIINQFKNRARKVCRSGFLFGSLKFIIYLDQILITNLCLTNSNPSNSMMSEIGDSREKSHGIETEKMVLIHQHRNLLENSFPKTSGKFTNQELI